MTRPLVWIAALLPLLGCDEQSGAEPAEKPARAEERTAGSDDDGGEPASGAASEPDGPPEPLDAEAIAKAAGAESSRSPDGTVRIGWARDDVPVTVDGIDFPPAQGLGSWAAFTPHDGAAMVMGDTVVFEDEVDAALDAALENHLAVTALHNHFLHDEPKVYFMHIGGTGDAVELAGSVAKVWNAIRAVRAEHPEPREGFGGDPVEPGGEIDAAAIQRIVGHAAQRKPGGVVKVAVGRAASMGGTEVGKSMGVATWAAFSGSDERAMMDGDFAMDATEVAEVLKALRAEQVHVVALHNHMINEQPALYFLHFWKKGPAAELAKAFRAGLDAQRAAR